MKVFKLDIGGNPLIATLPYVLETLLSEEENWNIGDTYTIEAVEMTQEEIDKLPEWDGP
jgi:hypothetical protein